jgi:hypothetical protein
MYSIFDFLTSESSKSLNLVCKSSFAEQLKRSYHLQEKGEGVLAPSSSIPTRYLRIVPL